MSNNFHNFDLPRFQEKYGQDWDAFLAIVGAEIDTLFAKVLQLYRLRDPGLVPVSALDKALRVRAISYEATDSVAVRRAKLRHFASVDKRKALADFYLDLAEAVVGIRGEISVFEGFIWDEGYWQGESDTDTESAYLSWTLGGDHFDIFIDVKTTDAAKLDAIVALYRQPSVQPAFYTIYLVKTTPAFEVLRTV